MMNKTWIKVALPVVVIVLGLVGMNAIGASGQEEEEKKEVDSRPTVRVESIESLNHQVTITGHGEVKPLESTQLSAQVSGEVLSWHPSFVAGGIVKRGDVLFEIDQEPYQVSVLQAEANLISAQARLIEEQGRSDVAKQEAKTLPSIKVTDLYLRKPQLMSAKAAVKSAKAALRLAKSDLQNCTVVAPYDALVVSRDLGKGQFVTPGARIGQLFNIEKAEVTFPIAGFDSAFLPSQVMGQTATVATDGRFQIKRQAKVVRDAGIVDSATRMSNIVVRVDDPYGIKHGGAKLKFGTYVEVTFNGQQLNNVFRLSQDLVSNKVVWVVNGDNQLEKRMVDVIREEGDFFVIGDGLTSADQIVLTLPEYPQQGMEVKIAGQESETDKEEESEDNEGKLLTSQGNDE